MNFQILLPDKLDAIYGAAVGGGVAIIVSFLSNRHALKRLKLELSHQASQRELERQLTLKRDIYIPLLEAASNALSFYGQIATVPMDLIKQPEPLNSLGRHVAKLNGIASENVVEAVHNAHKQIAVGIIKLFKQRIAIEAISAQIASIDSQIKHFESKSDDFNERFEKHIDAGTGSEELRNVLIQLAKDSRERVQKLYNQKNDLTLEKAAAELNVTRSAMQDVLEMGPKTRGALVAIRKDLGLPIDEKWLAGLFDTTSKELAKAIGDFCGDIEKVIIEQKAKNSASKPA